MSHELRTPLNAILGYAQILQLGSGLTVQQGRGLQTIRSSGEHLLTLINDILDLAKIDAARLELDAQPVQLQPFLRVIADIIRVRCEEKGLHFECHTADLPDTVRVDEKRLRQVLLNLLANAVNFTDRGEVSLRVRGAPAEAGMARLQAQVCDTGIGIDARHHESIFQAFEQVHTPGRRAGGTGLGLPISRQLVRLMGGDIRVDSAPGTGSTFSFELSVPVVESHVDEAQAAARIAGYRGRRRRLLIVDDIEANRDVLADYLAPLGFKIEHASSGEEAVEQVRKAPPDLVLMDVVLPAMDGLEATRLIRGVAGMRQPAIVAVSANASGGSRERSLTAGANGFLSKPIDRDLLLQELASHLALEWVVEPRAGEAGTQEPKEVQ